MPTCVGQSGQNQPHDSRGGRNGMEETKHQHCQAARAGGHQCCPLPPQNLPVLAAHVRQSCWVLWRLAHQAAPDPKRSSSKMLCQHVWGLAHALPIYPLEPGKLMSFHALQTSHPSGRSLQVPKHKSPSRPSDHPSTEGQGGWQAVIQPFGWERQKVTHQVPQA